MDKNLAFIVVLLVTPVELWAVDCPHDTWVFGDANGPHNSSNYIPDNVEKDFRLTDMNDVVCTVKKTEFNKMPGAHGQGTEIYQTREVECTVSKGTSVIFDLIPSDRQNGISIIKNGVRDYVTLSYCK